MMTFINASEGTMHVASQSCPIDKSSCVANLGTKCPCCTTSESPGTCSSVSWVELTLIPEGLGVDADGVGSYALVEDLGCIREEMCHTPGIGDGMECSCGRTNSKWCTQ